MVDRVTHAYEGPLAVFLIGLRVHKPWRIGIAGRSFVAMPRMLAELEKNKAAAERGEEESLGYLASRMAVNGLGVTVIQWWRSVEDIYAYANAPSLAHRPAWLAFHRAARKDPSAVTIWHETYAVSAAESVLTAKVISEAAVSQRAIASWPRLPGCPRSAKLRRPMIVWLT